MGEKGRDRSANPPSEQTVNTVLDLNKLNIFKRCWSSSSPKGAVLLLYYSTPYRCHFNGLGTDKGSAVAL